jgi:hypothetical protein
LKDMPNTCLPDSWREATKMRNQKWLLVRIKGLPQWEMQLDSTWMGEPRNKVGLASNISGTPLNVRHTRRLT